MAQRWFVAIGGKKFGPLSQNKLRRIAEKRILSADDHVWMKGMKEWVQAKEIRGLIPDEFLNSPVQAASLNGNDLNQGKWYYNNEGNKLGPITITELKQLAEQKIITKETFLLEEGAGTGWRQAGQCQDLALELVSKGMSHSHPLFRLLTKWTSA